MTSPQVAEHEVKSGAHISAPQRETLINNAMLATKDIMRRQGRQDTIMRRQGARTRREEEAASRAKQLAAAAQQDPFSPQPRRAPMGEGDLLELQPEPEISLALPSVLPKPPTVSSAVRRRFDQQEVMVRRKVREQWKDLCYTFQRSDLNGDGARQGESNEGYRGFT
jgi:hypothetical protein